MTAEHPYTVRHRTHLAGALRASDVGTQVRLGGWVHRRRALGGIVFVDLRDRAGIVQVSFDPRAAAPAVIDAAAALGAETVVLLEGEVVERPESMRNAELGTGDVEIRATSLRVVGPAATPAIPVARGKGELLPAEELRLRHRHLDLRRPELQRNLILRHRLMQATRRYFDSLGFLEVETPILTKPTPEGARDYLVPSRVHPGEFYALPQSPQLYKQLLMISGFDRYFQIARCFRDEDLRADRQPEFTQIDVEAAFVGPEDVMTMAEGLVRTLWREGGQEAELPFPRMKYADAMERYGSDKPDLRFALEIADHTDAFRDAELGITRDAIAKGGRVRGIRVPHGATLSRKQVDEIEAAAKTLGAAGLLRLKRQGGALEGPPAKYLSSGAADRLGLEDGDLLLLVAGPDHVSSPALDRVRHELAEGMHLIPPNTNVFLWVVDFPLFVRDPKTGALQSVNHPFTGPHPDDEPLLEQEPERVRSLAYDVILTGTELGGGSLRIGDPRLQSRVFALLGLDEQTAEARFGFLLEALRAGAPPHGGIAFGFDRIAMLISGAESLRDVIAFPKTTKAAALFEGAPVRVRPEDLRELHISLDGHSA
ncbi:MAG: aspartate--tRNA ligase [Gemmatimonadaceae bacterium]